MAEAWPPPKYEKIWARMRTWEAWYVGEAELLSSAANSDDTGRGLKGLVANTWDRWWGQTAYEAATQRQTQIKIHVPLAADIATMSADNLMADPPKFKSDDQVTQERLTGMVDDGLHVVLRSALELCAAIGGIYLKTIKDFENEKVAILAVDADRAMPTFRLGKMVAVTFWSVMKRTETKVYRHLEHHDLDPVTGNGRILHELWEGTEDSKGSLVPWEEDDVLEYFIDVIDNIDPDTGYIDTGTEGLDCVYIPNRLPNGVWGKTAAGKYLGAPDIRGSEDLLDRLDHTRSALFREVDLAQARIMVPDFMMKDLGAGRGLGFDMSQRIFTQLSMPPTTDGAAASIQMFQPAMRVDQFQAIERTLVKDILRNAGYSASSFGEEDEGGAAMTATEINSRDRRSKISRANKIRLAKPAIEDILTKALHMENDEGWSKTLPETIEVAFPADGKMTFSEAAQSIALLLGVGGISQEVAVETLHSDWDDDQIVDEVNRLKADAAAAAEMENPDEATVIPPGSAE